MGVSTHKGLPPKNYHRLIDEYATIMSDPVRKLRFIKKALSGFEKIPRLYRLYPPFAEIAFRNILLGEAERLFPGSRPVAAEFIKKGIISSPHPTLRNAYRFRHSIFLLVMAGLVWGLSSATAALNDLIRPPEQRGFGRLTDRKVQGVAGISVDRPPATGDSQVRKEKEQGRTAGIGNDRKRVVLVRVEHNRGDRQETNESSGTEAQRGTESLSGSEKIQGDEQNTSDEGGSDSEEVASAGKREAEAGGARTGNSEEDPNEEGHIREPGKEIDTRLVALKTTPGFPIGKGKDLSPWIRAAPEPKPCSEYIGEPIWLVEKGKDREIYSNGLQIVTSFVVDNEARRYVTFPKTSEEPPHWKTEIRGILYHASESDLVPFKQEKNQTIKRFSSMLRQYVSRNKMYHYLIDPFGRVFRIVREEHAAFHAGNSIWADGEEIFLNLNHAFLGICFEGKGFEQTSDAGSGKQILKITGTSVVNEAQIRSGKDLTDWLRYKYRIPQRNCLPHGIVSIYPEDRLIGYHLDLSYGFPFRRFGLQNKYMEMLPSMVEYGFTYDQYFVNIFKGNLWPGIYLSEEFLRKKAEDAGVSLKDLRKNLQLRFEQHSKRQKDMLEEKGG